MKSCSRDEDTCAAPIKTIYQKKNIRECTERGSMKKIILQETLGDVTTECRDQLARKGFAITLVNDLTQFAQRLQQTRYDVAFFDAEADLNAVLALCAQVRSFNTRLITVVIGTEEKDSLLRQYRDRVACVDLYLEKPTTINALFDLLETM